MVEKRPAWPDTAKMTPRELSLWREFGWDIYYFPLELLQSMKVLEALMPRWSDRASV